MIEITFLADHPEVIPWLAQGALDGEPDYYGGCILEDIAQDFQR